MPCAMRWILFPKDGGWSSLPSGNLLHSYGQSPCSMGKPTISMAMFNTYVELPEGIDFHRIEWDFHTYSFILLMAMDG